MLMMTTIQIYIDVHVKTCKISFAHAPIEWFETVRGIGYS